MKNKEKDFPLISIAIVTYNQRQYLEECIKSCLNQSYPNFELIISDDCSTDGTIEYLRKLEEDNIRVKVVYSNVNTGITKNYNRACKKCVGSWIKPIAGDDKLARDCLIKFYEYSLINKYDLIFSDCKSFSDNSSDGILYKPSKAFFDASKEQKKKMLLVKNRLNAPSCFIKRQVLESVGYADERFPMVEDYPLWLKIAQAEFTFGYLQDVLIDYRIGESTYNNVKRIGNISYLRSMYDFQKNEIWPNLSGLDKLKILDDWAFYSQRSLWLKFFENRKTNLYKVYSFLFLPFRVFSVLNRFLKSNCHL